MVILLLVVGSMTNNQPLTTNNIYFCYESPMSYAHLVRIPQSDIFSATAMAMGEYGLACQK